MENGHTSDSEGGTLAHEEEQQPQQNGHAADGDGGGKDKTGDDVGSSSTSSSSDSSSSGSRRRGSGTFDARAALSEEQLQKLDEFKRRLFEGVPPDDSPFRAFNEKNKNKKRAADEPPVTRLWVDELTDKQKQVSTPFIC